ncbi:MAG TPA: S8 family serine peptidase [Anaerolineae bacterium]|nr:S8 family serine peptidase [Anaerolineae bacterium]
MSKSRITIALLVLGLMLSTLGAGSLFAQDQPFRLVDGALTADSVETLPEKEGGDASAELRSLNAASAAEAAGGLVSVIVKLDDAPLATYDGSLSGLPATSPNVTGAPLDVDSAASQLYLGYLAQEQDRFVAEAAKAAPTAQITHRFDIIIGGVSMLVPADQVEALSKLPGVQAVYVDELLQLDTERSPQFIGAPTTWNKLGGQQKAGEGVIVGVLDTGVWPEHPSFSDPDPSGKPYAAPPPAPDGDRACEFSGGANPGPAFTCNNKLIGADRFLATYDAIIGLLPNEFTTARDDDGHGTHTSSTAAGNRNVAASIFGVSRGLVSGIAPRAHVIMYKVCGFEGCFSSDSAAAVQEAIQDGVNVINFSISGGGNPYADAVSLAFLDAYNAGVFVAASAGNSGPGADTTDHREPWVTTVAASTQARAFVNTISVNGGALTLTGASVTAGVGPLPVVVNTGDPLCQTPAAPGTFTGQIVVCQRGVNGRVNKGFNVFQGNAAGMILYNQSTAVTDLETDNHFLPTSHIQFTQGQTLLTFLAANPGATASLSAGVSASAQGDVMASFSSRGGPGQTLGISKPDITAPGVQILAGHTPQSANPDTGPQGELFQAIAGTSMSSPHIAGSAALLKDLHPNWTPGQIKSALMTTAEGDVVKEDGVTPTTPFDDGSGRVDLRKAWNPGLTFSDSGANYLAHQNDLWNANYPSLYVPVMPGLVTVQRTAHSELHHPSVWITSVDAPADLDVDVPKVIFIPGGGNKTFDITVDARDVPLGEVRHATIHLRSALHRADFPITIVRKQPTVALEKSCDPGTFPRFSTTDCTITITNNSFDDATVSLVDKMPKELAIVPGSVVGAVEQNSKLLTFDGTLAGAEPPDVTIAADPGGSPAGYLPLSLFGVTPIAGMGDETIANFSVPSFTFAGQSYSGIGLVSNGYAVVGGGTGADVEFINQSLPDAAPPNNVLAPFWTDLNPGAGGAMRIAVLASASGGCAINDCWIVLEWTAVKEFSTTRTDTFQIWIGINGDANPAEDITFTYGTLQGNGDLGFLTVGAENLFGNRGQNYYVDGAGTLPTAGTELRVTGTPPVPGDAHIITFQAKGVKTGKWDNYAEMTSDLFFGTNIARFSGEVTHH